MPELQKMQVNVGIHESIVDRVKLGMLAKVSIPDSVIQGEVVFDRFGCAAGRLVDG